MTSSLRFVTPVSKLLPDQPRPLHRETRTTAPSGRPVTAAELDAFARLDGLYTEAVRNDAIDAAVAFVEQELIYAVLAQTWTITVENAWPDAGVIPLRRPFGSVSSVKTIDPEGDDTTWTEAMYYVAPGNCVKAVASTAPISIGENQWFEIVYTAGHALAADVPARLKQAIMIVAAEMLVWNRDVGAMPNMWPGNSWQLACEFQGFRGV